MTPAVDPNLGLVVFGTGNPMPALGGEARAGDNLFANSAIALDLRSGVYRWHYQLVHHDLWEADLGTPLVLYEAQVHGKTRKAVAVMRTDGYLFLLDRRTGRPVFPVEERRAKQNERLKTAATQPFPVGADQMGSPCVESELVPAGFKLGCAFDPVDVDRPNLMLPKYYARSAPMAYDPVTGYFYATGTVGAAWFKRFDDPYFLSEDQTPGQKSYGIFVAIDQRTNKIVWRKRMKYPLGNGSGALATGGGLVFHGEPDGNLQAYDARDGALLWQFQTGSMVDGPAATYEIDGEQYVTVVASGAVWSFKLGGAIAPLLAPLPPATEVTFGGRAERTDRIVLGAVISDMGLNGHRETLDEHVIKPVRARVNAGAPVTWINHGRLIHEVQALDGSWHSGPISPGASASLTFSRPGTYTYICSEHPWVYAQIIIE